MSGTFLESSLIDCTGEGLESCVSEMMNGLDPASKTLWIFPESVGAKTHTDTHKQSCYYSKTQCRSIFFLAHCSQQR